MKAIEQYFPFLQYFPVYCGVQGASNLRVCGRNLQVKAIQPYSYLEPNSSVRLLVAYSPY